METTEEEEEAEAKETVEKDENNCLQFTLQYVIEQKA